MKRRDFLQIMGIGIGSFVLNPFKVLKQDSLPMVKGKLGKFQGVNFIESDNTTADMWAKHWWKDAKKPIPISTIHCLKGSLGNIIM